MGRKHGRRRGPRQENKGARAHANNPSIHEEGRGDREGRESGCGDGQSEGQVQTAGTRGENRDGTTRTSGQRTGPPAGNRAGTKGLTQRRATQHRRASAPGQQARGGAARGPHHARQEPQDGAGRRPPAKQEGAGPTREPQAGGGSGGRGHRKADRKPAGVAGRGRGRPRGGRREKEEPHQRGPYRRGRGGGRRGSGRGTRSHHKRAGAAKGPRRKGKHHERRRAGSGPGGVLCTAGGNGAGSRLQAGAATSNNATGS